MSAIRGRRAAPGPGAAALPIVADEREVCRRGVLAKTALACVGVGALVAAGCRGLPTVPAVRPPSVLIEYAWSNATGVVEGTLQNTSRRGISSVSIVFLLLDAEGEPVLRVTVRRADTIAPRGFWDFQAPANHPLAVRVARGRTDVS